MRNKINKNKNKNKNKKNEVHHQRSWHRGLGVIQKFNNDEKCQQE